jgi:archaellum biogenesis ATPase FlaH
VTSLQHILHHLPQTFVLGIHAPFEKRLQAYKVLHHVSTPGIAVTLHRPAHNLLDMLQAQGLPTNNLYFIDAISKCIQSGFELPNASYVGAPFDLGRLDQAMDHVAKSYGGIGRKFLIFDSLHNLLHFYDEATILSFLDYFLDKMRKLHVNPIILYDKSKLTRKIIKRLQLYCNHLVEV